MCFLACFFNTPDFLSRVHIPPCWYSKMTSSKYSLPEDGYVEMYVLQDTSYLFCIGIKCCVQATIVLF